MRKRFLVICMFFLLVISSIDPLSFGYKLSEKEVLVENYDCYNDSEITDYGSIPSYEYDDFIDIESEKVNISKQPSKPLNGPPINSPWPMYCHDVKHTGRSPYSTADNPYDVKWMFGIYGPVWSGPIIDEEGIIYIGSDSVYAIYPNGTLKWRYEERFRIASTPAIDENGVLYVGAYWAGPQYMYAIYKDNGTLKWKFYVGNWIASSPAIGDDGSIYFGSEDDYIYALYPNGTLKWKYLTSIAVYSSPAIGPDGTVYCGSHDSYLYALYPDNGTLKWKYGTGNWIRVSPCIGDDGAIFVVSLDNYLHAVNPDGSLKWKTDVGAGTSPTISQDGTIYCGYDRLFAVNPTNGSVKWTFDVGGKIRGATPCNSIDGTIYLGNYDGSDIIAINPDGTEKWRKYIGGDIESAPAIGEDGTVYIGSGMDDGYLYAFGPLDPIAPSAPIIDGSASGHTKKEYSYTFRSTSQLNRGVYYYIDWGDNTIIDWTGPYTSGQTITINHTWNTKGTFTINARAKDTENLWGPWSKYNVSITPKSRADFSSLFLSFLERFPILEILLQISSLISF